MCCTLDCRHDPVRPTEHLRGTRESEQKKNRMAHFKCVLVACRLLLWLTKYGDEFSQCMGSHRVQRPALHATHSNYTPMALLPCPTARPMPEPPCPTLQSKSKSKLIKIVNLQATVSPPPRGSRMIPGDWALTRRRYLADSSSGAEALLGLSACSGRTRVALRKSHSIC